MIRPRRCKLHDVDTELLAEDLATGSIVGKNGAAHITLAVGFLGMATLILHTPSRRVARGRASACPLRALRLKGQLVFSTCHAGRRTATCNVRCGSNNPTICECGSAEALHADAARVAQSDVTCQRSAPDRCQGGREPFHMRSCMDRNYAQRRRWQPNPRRPGGVLKATVSGREGQRWSTCDDMSAG